MGINANKKVKRRKVRINGNKNSTNNWGITAAGWNAVHKAIINAEDYFTSFKAIGRIFAAFFARYSRQPIESR